jgi:superfamily II DNA helicase RecQ
MLAYQLNPHFLFNTLNSLRAMIGEDPTRARRMVTELAEFLRYALVHHPLVVHWQHPASVEDYLQEFGRAGRDGRVSVAVVFIGEKDEGLLRFMAEKTVEGARIGPSSKKEVLEAKYHAIGEMRRVATSSSACFRNVIVRYFEESPSPHRRPLAVRIVDWLFSRSVTPRRTQFCCDRCDQVGVDNVIAWAAQVFGQTR